MKSKSESGSAGFLSGEISGLVRGTEPSENPDTDGLKKAVERHSLPKRVKRLEEKLDALKPARASHASDGQCELVHLVAAAKHLLKAKVLKAKGKGSHHLLAVKVDSMLESAQKELRDVCPESWRSVKDLPRLFSDALKHPKLKRKAAVLISKAH
jgi:thymidylate synthase ThyX